MIVESLFDVIFNFVTLLLSAVPNVDIPTDTTYLDTLSSMFKFIGYFLPMQTILVVVYISIGLQSLRIVISIIKTIWGLLPLV